MCDRAVHAPLGGRHTALEARGHLLHPVAQLDEGLLERGGVRREVGLLAAEDGALRRAQPAQLHGEHDHPQKRNRRDARGREGHDALGGVQVVHGRQGTQRTQRVKMTVKSPTLLSVTSSPGTAFTLTSIGTFCPVGGCSVSGIVTFLASPAAISGSSPQP